MEAYNGSAVVAMAGKNCVAIASDLRLGINQFSTISSSFQKVFRLSPRCYIGLGGLATDVQTVHRELVFRANLYQLREEVKEMPVSIVSNVLSSMLYERRFAPFFVSPVVAGLHPDTHEPFLSAFDYIGAACYAKDFVCTGSATEQLVGICESLWQPDMNEEQLGEVLSQCLLCALDRDCVAGWAADVHIMEVVDVYVPWEQLRDSVDWCECSLQNAKRLVTRKLKCRMD